MNPKMTDKTMNKYQRLLDLTFELEGMARLASERDGDGELEKRVEAKAREIHTLLFGEEKPVEKTEEPAAADFDDSMFYSLPEPEAETDPDPEPQPEESEPAIEEIPVAEDEPEPAPEPEPEPEPEPKPAPAPSAPKSKPLLSINDRFRFRRELFGNSDPDFNDALNLIATMDSYDEAEDYFINSLDWDQNNPVVMEFMALLQRYYK